MDLVEKAKEAAAPLSDGKLDWRDAVAVAKLLVLAGLLLLQVVAVLGGPKEEAPTSDEAAETDSE